MQARICCSNGHGARTGAGRERQGVRVRRQVRDVRAVSSQVRQCGECDSHSGHAWRIQCTRGVLQLRTALLGILCTLLQQRHDAHELHCTSASSASSFHPCMCIHTVFSCMSAPSSFSSFSCGLMPPSASSCMPSSDTHSFFRACLPQLVVPACVGARQIARWRISQL